MTLLSMRNGLSSGARIAAALGLAATLSLSGCMTQGTDGADAGDDTSVETVAPKEDDGSEVMTTGAGYEHQDVDGLTVDKLVDELYPSASLSEALQDDPMEVGEEIAHWLATEGGYNTGASPLEGGASAHYDEGTIRVDVDGEAFVIKTGLYGNQTLYEYRSTVIPTADEARQLALDNIPQ